MIGLLTCGQVELPYMVSEWTLCSFTNDWSINLWSAGVILSGEWQNVVLLQPWLVCWPLVSWSHLLSWVTERCTPSPMIGLLICGLLESKARIVMYTRFIDLFYSLYKFYTTRITYSTQQILWTRLKYTHTRKINHVLTNRTKQASALFEHTHVTLSIPKILSFKFYTNK